MSKPVGRTKINEEQMPARFPRGTLARIDALSYENEPRSEFIRSAVEAELRRRSEILEREGKLEPPHGEKFWKY